MVTSKRQAVILAPKWCKRPVQMYALFCLILALHSSVFAAEVKDCVDAIRPQDFHAVRLGGPDRAHIWKITRKDGKDYVLRFRTDTDDISFEIFSSIISDQVAPGRNSKVEKLSPQMWMELIASLEARRNDQTAELLNRLKVNRKISLTPYLNADRPNPRLDTDFIHGTAHFLFNRYQEKSRRVWQEYSRMFGRSERFESGFLGIDDQSLLDFKWVAARVLLSESILKEISEAWVIRTIVGDTDFHRLNWLVSGGHAVGIDMAQPSLADDEGLDVNNPLAIFNERAELVDAIFLRSLSKEFISRLKSFDFNMIAKAGEESGFAPTDGRILNILKRRDQFLRRIEFQQPHVR
jgi:hypothetical protein